MMIRRICMFTAALGAMTGAALADPASWQGTFFVTIASPPCASSGNSIGEFGTVLYRPIINPGDAAEGLSFFFTRSTETIISTSGSGKFHGAASYSGFETGHHVYPNQFNGKSSLTISPQNITADTTAISINGRINNFFNNSPSCDVTISATLLPRL